MTTKRKTWKNYQDYLASPEWRAVKEELKQMEEIVGGDNGKL